jgi:dihydrofolate reductase
VFSRSLSTVSASSRLASADIPDEIASLRTQPGKDLVVFGGVSTAQQFVRHRLVDQYWIKVYPIALGIGQPLFTDLDHRASLQLVHNKAYDSESLPSDTCPPDARRRQARVVTAPRRHERSRFRPLGCG